MMEISRLRSDLLRLLRGINQIGSFDNFDYGVYKDAGARISRFLRVVKTINQRLAYKELLDIFLEFAGEKDVHYCPELISSIGFIVDSDDISFALKVRRGYNNHIGCKPREKLRRSPHLDIIKELPHHFYDQPAYFAPVEDLLDHLAIRFYVGKVAGDAEDGAIGWIISEILRNKDYKLEDLLDCMGKELKHWSADRLKSCLEVWENKVAPVLPE